MLKRESLLYVQNKKEIKKRNTNFMIHPEEIIIPLKGL